MCVCVCECVYVCIYYINIYVCVCVYVCMYVCVCVCVCLCVCVCVCLFVCVMGRANALVADPRSAPGCKLVSIPSKCRKWVLGGMNQQNHRCFNVPIIDTMK